MFLFRTDRHCFYRHSPDLLSQTYSFSLCVYHSDGDLRLASSEKIDLSPHVLKGIFFFLSRSQLSFICKVSMPIILSVL